MEDEENSAEEFVEDLGQKVKSSLENLPENYRILYELFRSMTIELEVLDYFGRKPTYEIVRDMVQDVTKRRLLPRHLAQMKYILPEAVQIDYVIAESNCMMSEMKIELLYDVVDGRFEKWVFNPLCFLFASRLRDFYAAHPEPDTDIPEAALPEPFDPIKHIVRKHREAKDLPFSCDSDSSSLSHSPFKRCLSKNTAGPEIESLTHFKSACVINDEKASICESTPVKLDLGTDGLLVENNYLDGQDTEISSMELCDEDNN